MKKCCSCKKKKKFSEFYVCAGCPDGYQYECKVCMKNRINLWRAEDSKKNPEKYRKLGSKWRNANLDRARFLQREKRRRLRYEVLSAYSKGKPKCKCCGEKEINFLSLDHINNDGRKHRKEVGGSNGIYISLRKLKYPKGYQVLCYNCNLAKGFLGYCPHEQNTKRPIRRNTK